MPIKCLYYLGPGGTPLCMYMPPQRVFAAFWSENGTAVDFWSGIGYGFRRHYGSVRTYLLFQFHMSKKEKEICQFEWILRNLFCCCCNLSNDDVIS